MHKTCTNCETSNSENARFCVKCGTALHSHEHAHERTPADQATEMSDKAKVEVSKAMGRTKHIWSGFSKSEKIMAIGGVAGLVAFILPWVSVGGQSINGFLAASNNGYTYLLPLLMIASLVLLYFTQGASDTHKALMTRWQIIIGSVASTVGLFMAIFISAIGSLMSQMMGGIGALFGGGFGVSAGIGVYLYAAGAIAVLVGAFRKQGEMLWRIGE